MEGGGEGLWCRLWTVDCRLACCAGESDELSDAVNRGQGRAGPDCVGQTPIAHPVKSNLTPRSWLSEYEGVQTRNFKPSDFHH